MDGGRRQSDDQRTAGTTATTHPQAGRNMSGGAAFAWRPMKERTAAETGRQDEGVCVGGGWGGVPASHLGLAVG